MKELSVFFTKTWSVLRDILPRSFGAVFVSSLENSESICVQPGQLRDEGKLPALVLGAEDLSSSLPALLLRAEDLSAAPSTEYHGFVFQREPREGAFVLALFSLKQVLKKSSKPSCILP